MSRFNPDVQTSIQSFSMKLFSFFLLIVLQGPLIAQKPELVGKLMGFNQEPLRDVASMDKKLELFPEVTLSLRGEQLDIQLREREGGVGMVALFIGSKEKA